MSKCLLNTLASSGDTEKLTRELAPIAAQYIHSNITHILTFVSSFQGDTMAHKDDRYDYSIYTGMGGIALALHHTSIKNLQDEARRYLRGAVSWMEMSKPSSKVGFFCTRSGIMALACVMAAADNDSDLANRWCESLLQQIPIAVSECNCDEVLYGRAGLLWALLWVRSLPVINRAMLDSGIVRLGKRIVESGKSFSADQTGWWRSTKSPPLMYSWHDSPYLGAAHGLSGILYVLLLFAEHAPDLASFITSDVLMDSVDACLDTMHPNGTWPSRPGVHRKHPSCQWCHGAPGMVFLACKAAQVFSHRRDDYIGIARRAAACVWEHGLLLKGPGLCHGIAGNGYSLLALYRLTKDPQYLFQSLQFASMCISPPITMPKPTPDRPFSLMEGIAGPICFVNDVMNPDTSRFPGYEF